MTVAALVATPLAVVGTYLAVTTVPASATTVDDDASFRAAWSNPNETKIDLRGSITMDCALGTYQRSGTVPLTVEGHGYTLTAQGCNRQLLLQVDANTLTLSDVTLTGANLSDPVNSVGGAAVQTNGDLVLNATTVAGNAATGGPWAEGGAIDVPFGHTLTLRRSTVSGNQVGCTACSAVVAGGGIFAGTVVARDSTVSNNAVSGTTGAEGGGIFAVFATLTYTTLADNTAQSGANVSLIGKLTTFGSVIGDAHGASGCAAAGGTTSNGYNWNDDGSCALSQATDQPAGGDPHLAPLAFNGGMTQTRLPEVGSGLVDAIPAAHCGDDGAALIVPLNDQRGIPRPFGNGCDIGSVETFADTFSSLPPARILDTRFAPGPQNPGGLGTFAPQQTQQLTVVNVGGVPASGADAVLLNVTVTGPTHDGWLTVFPADAPLPTTSNLNFRAGETVPNLVVVKVGHGGANEGKISINNTGGSPSAGSADVIADVVGYYRDPTLVAANRFTGLAPTRLLDTRFPAGAQNPGGLATFQPQQTQTLQVGGAAGVPAGADSVVLNVTATGPSAPGWLTVFPSGSVPTASNLNFTAGETVANLVTVQLNGSGQVQINNTGGNNQAGTVDVVADVVGFYQAASGSALVPIAPQRILDTRNGTGGVKGPVAPQASILCDPQTATGLPPAGSYTAVIVNVTATNTTANGWLTVFPSNQSLPPTSNLNFLAGQTVPNLVKIAVGADGKIAINNTGGNPNAGTADVVADIVGYYQ
jgi:hypothetical protein